VIFLWVVPVVAASVAVGLVLARMRRLEDLSRDLMAALQRTAELRAPLAAVRSEMARSGPLVDRVWMHWSKDGDGTEQGS
jgi:hypothetical protein